MPDLTLPVAEYEIAKIVAREFDSHAAHVRDRAAADTLAQAATDLRERADRLRSHPDPADPVVAALTALCHTEGARIHASPHLVAAVALDAVAALLAAPEPLDTPSEVAP